MIDDNIMSSSEVAQNVLNNLRQAVLKYKERKQTQKGWIKGREVWASRTNPGGGSGRIMRRMACAGGNAYIYWTCEVYNITIHT